MWLGMELRRIDDYRNIELINKNVSCTIADPSMTTSELRSLTLHKGNLTEAIKDKQTNEILGSPLGPQL